MDPTQALLKLIPGGIKTTDTQYVARSEDACSRCHRGIHEDEVPLMIWGHGGHVLWIYCNDCTGEGYTPAPPDWEEDYPV